MHNSQIASWLPVLIVVAGSFSYTTAPGQPTDLRAILVNNTVTVSWTPPSGGTPPTGYIIYYEATSGGADTGSVTVNGVGTSEDTITGRASGAYTVRIMALSAQLPSIMTETTSSKSNNYSEKYQSVIIIVDGSTVITQLYIIMY